LRAAAIAVACAWCLSAAAAPPRLLDGVRAFQAGDYARALADFEAVAQAPDPPPDMAFYLGPTLYKLGRYEEALAVFVAARAATADALSSFYVGQTYYQLRLYRKARAVFVALRGRGLGPRLAAAAETYVALVDALDAAPVAPAAIDSYRARGQKLLAAGQAAVGAEFLDEARLIEALSAPRSQAERPAR
jgi:tetratricopeptide (TPR) repeat protein